MAMLVSVAAVAVTPQMGLAIGNTLADAHDLTVLDTDTTTPAFDWTYYDAEGDPQAGWWLEVWTGPDGSGDQMWGIDGKAGDEAVYDSDGLAVPLVWGGTYYVRVCVSDGGGTGPWSEVAFTIGASPVPAPEVVCVPWKGMEVLYHPTWSGLEVTLKGTVRYPGDVQWTWSFGDMTPATTGLAIVGDDHPYPIGAQHIYNGPVGAQFVAMLNVTALSGPAAGSWSTDIYKVQIRDAGLRRTQADVAIDEGLWWLYKVQDRSTVGVVDIGSWTSGWDEQLFMQELQMNWSAAWTAGQAAHDVAYDAELQDNWPAAWGAASAAYQAVIDGGGSVEEAEAAFMHELHNNWPDAEKAAEQAGHDALMAEVQNNYPLAWAAANTVASQGNYRVAYTGSALESFEVNNHHAAGDPGKDPYVDCVRRGLNYLTQQTEVVDISTDPMSDMNGNGIGISCYYDFAHEMYEIGLAMIALVGSRTPGRMAPNGPPGVVGRTYAAIAQDMADFIAYGQSTEGGWRYKRRDPSGCDNSCTQWPIIGLEPAEAKWGILVAPDVRPSLNLWLTGTQAASGGFGYTTAEEGPNIAKTAGTGITGLLFCGATPADPRLQDAIAYIDAEWNTVNDLFWGGMMNFGNDYAMYGVFKGFCVEFLDMDVIPGPGTHNWWNEYCDYIVPRQQPDGSWDRMQYADPQMCSAWMVTILTRALYDVPPLADARANGFDSTEVDKDQLVFFDGTHSVNGTYEIVLYEWDFESDGTYDAVGPTALHSFADYGNYTATLRVTDNRDIVTGGTKPAMTSTDTCHVWVHPPPHPPIPDANGPYLAQPGMPVELDGTGSWDPNEPEDYIEVWSWDLNNDGVFGDAFGALVNHTWPDPGVYPIALMVQDSTALWSVEASRTEVRVGNHPPVADADGPYSGVVGQPVTLDGTGSYDPDPGDSIVSYSWDLNNDGEFGDAFGSLVNCTYAEPGMHIVRLKVEDTHGATDVDWSTVEVELEQAEETWTLMLYIAADNELGDSIPWSKVKQMFAEASYHPYVNVVGLWDGPESGDSKIFEKTAEGVVRVDDGGAVIGPKGEVDMGYPDTLIDFIDWVKANYPREASPIGVDKYGLIMWDHGAGWRSCSFLVDETDSDSMNMSNLSGALQTATDDGENPLDLVGFDASLMGMAEVAYEIRGWALYCVASEEVEPPTSWPYTAILTGLASNPDMTPEMAAGMIVDHYAQMYVDPLSPFHFPDATLSAVDLSCMDDVAVAVWGLTDTLEDFLGVYDLEFAMAREQVETFGDPMVGSVDLFNLAELIEELVPDEGAAIAATAVMEAVGVPGVVDGAVIQSVAGPGHSHASGMAIYYPDVEPVDPTGPEEEALQVMFYEPCYGYEVVAVTAFAVDTLWADYLLKAPRIVKEGLLAFYIPDVLILAHAREDSVIRMSYPWEPWWSEDLGDFTISSGYEIVVTPEGAIDVGVVAIGYESIDLDWAGVLETQVLGMARMGDDGWQLEKLTMSVPTWMLDLANIGGPFIDLLPESGVHQVEGLIEAATEMAHDGSYVWGSECALCRPYEGAVIAVPWLDMTDLAPEVYDTYPKFPCWPSQESTSIAIAAVNKAEHLNPVQYPQNLYQGWNSISLPVIPLDSDIESILSGYDGMVDGVIDSVEVVWAYDAASGEWRAYSPAAPEASDLAALEDGSGYMVKMVEDATLTVVGSNLLAGPNAPPEYDLVEGWNLMGYRGILPMPARGEVFCQDFGVRGEPSLTGRPEMCVYLGGYLEEDKVCFNRLQGYNRLSGAQYTADFLQPNEGYWVYITDPGSIPGLNDEAWVRAMESGCDKWIAETVDWLRWWMQYDGELALRLAWNWGWYELWAIAPSLVPGSGGGLGFF